MKNFSLRGIFVTLGALALLGVAIGSAQATIIIWNFTSPANVSVASPHTYLDTTSTFQIIASGFTTANAPTGGTWTPGTVASTLLFQKVDTPDETGLGLADLSADHEIAIKSMIQLDLANLITHGFTDPIMSIGSVQAGESFAVFGSNTAANAAGASGTLRNSGTGLPTVQTFSLSGYPSDQYIWITATNADVLLLNGLTAAVPEPSTILLLGSGLLGLGGIVWRRKQK